MTEIELLKTQQKEMWALLCPIDPPLDHHMAMQVLLDLRRDRDVAQVAATTLRGDLVALKSLGAFSGGPDMGTQANLTGLVNFRNLVLTLVPRAIEVFDTFPSGTVKQPFIDLLNTLVREAKNCCV